MIRQVSKFTSLVLSATMFAGNVVLAHASETNFWRERKKSLNSAAAKIPGDGLLAQLSPPLANLTPAFSNPIVESNLPAPFPEASRVPGVEKLLPLLAQHGTVHSVRVPRKINIATPIVVQIQDIHGNREAQENISKLILNILRDQPDAPVGVEGAAGPFDFSAIRAAEPNINKEVGEFYFKIGYITGSEYAAFQAEKMPTYIGVEDPDLYLKNAGAARTAIAGQDRLNERLRKWEARLARLKNKFYSTDLKQLDAQWQAKERGDLPLGVYIESAARNAAAPSLSAYPQMGFFLKAWDLEQTLDFSRVERERNTFLESLVQKLNPTDLQSLVSAGVSFHAGRLTYPRYFRLLKDVSEQAGTKLASFPAFDKYVDYVLRSDAIQPETLFKEIAQFERTLFGRLCRTTDEKELTQISFDFADLTKLVALQLTTEEWARVRERKTALNQFPKRLAEQSDSSDKKEESEEALARVLEPFETFYEAAEARNLAMVRNFIAQLRSSASVLVAGGFHNEGLTELLLERNCTVVSVSPKLSAENLEQSSNYLKDVFTLDKSPLDQLFSTPALSIPKTVALNPIGEPASALASTLLLLQRALTAAASGNPVSMNSPNGLSAVTVDTGNQTPRPPSGGELAAQAAFSNKTVKLWTLSRAGEFIAVAIWRPIFEQTWIHLPMAVILPGFGIFLVASVFGWLGESVGLVYLSMTVEALIGFALGHLGIQWSLRYYVHGIHRFSHSLEDRLKLVKPIQWFGYATLGVLLLGNLVLPFMVSPATISHIAGLDSLFHVSLETAVQLVGPKLLFLVPAGALALIAGISAHSQFNLLSQVKASGGGNNKDSKKPQHNIQRKKKLNSHPNRELPRRSNLLTLGFMTAFFIAVLLAGVVVGALLTALPENKAAEKPVPQLVADPIGEDLKNDEVIQNTPRQNTPPENIPPPNDDQIRFVELQDDAESKQDAEPATEAGNNIFPPKLTLYKRMGLNRFGLENGKIPVYVVAPIEGKYQSGPTLIGLKPTSSNGSFISPDGKITLNTLTLDDFYRVGEDSVRHPELTAVVNGQFRYTQVQSVRLTEQKETFVSGESVIVAPPGSLVLTHFDSEIQGGRLVRRLFWKGEFVLLNSDKEFEYIREFLSFMVSNGRIESLEGLINPFDPATRVTTYFRPEDGTILARVRHSPDPSNPGTLTVLGGGLYSVDGSIVYYPPTEPGIGKKNVWCGKQARRANSIYLNSPTEFISWLGYYTGAKWTYERFTAYVAKLGPSSVHIGRNFSYVDYAGDSIWVLAAAPIASFLIAVNLFGGAALLAVYHVPAYLALPVGALLLLLAYPYFILSLNLVAFHRADSRGGRILATLLQQTAPKTQTELLMGGFGYGVKRKHPYYSVLGRLNPFNYFGSARRYVNVIDITPLLDPNSDPKNRDATLLHLRLLISGKNGRRAAQTVIGYTPIMPIDKNATPADVAKLATEAGLSDPIVAFLRAQQHRKFVQPLFSTNIPEQILIQAIVAIGRAETKDDAIRMINENEYKLGLYTANPNLVDLDLLKKLGGELFLFDGGSVIPYLQYLNHHIELLRTYGGHA